MDEKKAGELKDVLDMVIKSIEEEGDMVPEAIDMWLDGIHLMELDMKHALLGSPMEFMVNTLNSRYLTVLEDNFERVLGYRPPVKVILDKTGFDDKPLRGEGYVIAPFNIAKLNIERVKRGLPRLTAAEYDPSMRIEDLPTAEEVVAEKAAKEAEKAAAEKYEEFTVNTDYTFDNFVVGGSNQFAHAAAKAVAENPAKMYNPYFIYGPSGVGKTHLMYAIANSVREKNPKMKIAYVKGEEFANQLIESIASRKTAAAFRERYRGVDMLLIDDVHFIAGREATQEEFFHTFNTLYEQHKQIVVSSDRPPKDMPLLEARLRSRFESGLLADIQAPDYDLRLAIMRKKAEQYGLILGVDVESFLAQNISSNVRQLEGVIKKLSAVYFLTGETPTINTVREYVPEFLRENESPDVIADKVIKITAEHFGVTPDDITGGKRDKNIKNARNAAMYVIHRMTDISLKNIGLMFGARTHSTVYSNCVAAESIAEADKNFAGELKSIEREARE